MDSSFDCKELRDEIFKIISSRCKGCIYDCPSQKYHSYCLDKCKFDIEEIVVEAKKNLHDSRNDQQRSTQNEHIN